MCIFMLVLKLFQKLIDYPVMRKGTKKAGLSSERRDGYCERCKVLKYWLSFPRVSFE